MAYRYTKISKGKHMSEHNISLNLRTEYFEKEFHKVDSWSNDSGDICLYLDDGTLHYIVISPPLSSTFTANRNHNHLRGFPTQSTYFRLQTLWILGQMELFYGVLA